MKKCNVCKRKPATHLTGNRNNGKWEFQCNICETIGFDYYIEIDRLIKENWIDHLSGKAWFKEGLFWESLS